MKESDMTGRGVLVVGATGTQGGAVADQLLVADAEYDVFALTRNPDAPAAQELASIGAMVVEGNLWEPETLRDPVAEVDTVFALTDYWEAGHDGEVTQGVNLVNVAADEGIDHFVFSSVSGAGLDTDVPMIESKARIEQHIHDMGLPATVVRPSYFMQNFELRSEDVANGKVALPLRPGARLPMVDTVDIGRFVATVIANREEYVGRTARLAGDELTLGEMADILGDVLDAEMQTVHIPIEVARSEFGDDYADLFAWYNQNPQSQLVREVRRQYDFEPTPFADYLRRADWATPELPAGPDMQQLQ
jgi:uncharacterized protein YbjT (DUF2867 family)